MIDDYLGGSWDEARANGEQVLNDVSDRTHYMQPAIRLIRAAIDVARGERLAPAAEAGMAVDEARRAADPQMLWPTLSGAAWIASECGDRDRSVAWLSELESSLEGSTAYRTGYGLLDAPLVAESREQVARLAAVITTRSTVRTPWVEAIELIAAGDLTRCRRRLRRRG